jgi:hypothetical protein
VNADTGRPSLDLWFGDSKTFSNIPYKTATDYVPVPAERRTFKVTVAGETVDLSTNSEGLSANGRYTLVAHSKDDGSTSLTALNDTVGEIEPGKAKIRVVHAAPGAGGIDIAARGRKEPLFDGLDPSTATGFTDVDPTVKALEIRREDRKGATTHIPNTNLEAGRAYTFIVAGKRGALETIRLENGAVVNQTARR